MQTLYETGCVLKESMDHQLNMIGVDQNGFEYRVEEPFERLALQTIND